MNDARTALAPKSELLSKANVRLGATRNGSFDVGYLLFQLRDFTSNLISNVKQLKFYMVFTTRDLPSD